MSQTYIIECSRINSVGVEGSGEDYDNKSSWTNQIAPIYLRQGDTVSLQNCLINIPGADTNAIQFQGTETTPGSQVQDNFTLMNVGFYMNHNGINTLAMPCQYLSAGDPFSTPPVAQETKVMLTETNKTVVDGNGDTVIANNLGSFQDIQYIFDPPGNAGHGPLDPADQINDSGSWKGNNPYFNINGKKFAKISPYYGGWWRDTSATAYQGKGVEPLLFTQDIPFLIKPGFTTPNSIADQMTEILSRTNKLRVDDIFTARAYELLYSDRNVDSLNLYQYAFNGYAYKTISANFQKHGDMTHRIYGNLAVDEPYLWKYGINIISNAEVDNLQGNRYITEGQDAEYANFRVDYPVVIWNIFAGDNPDDFDIDNEGQYRYYSPFVNKLKQGAGDDTILTTEGFTSNLSTFNDYLRQIITTANVGAYLYMTSANSFKIGLTSNVGINLVERPGLFEDNDSPTHTDIVAYNRFLGLNGSWDAVEHEIFKTTDIGQPGGTGVSYVFSGAGGGQPSEDWFEYFDDNNRKIAMGQSSAGLGFTGYVYISNLLTADSGGIVEGGEYKITFDLAIQAPYSWSNTAIGIGGNAVGLPFTTYTSDQTVEIEFKATASSIAANAIAFGVYYSNVGAVVNVSNISILREYTGTEEIYTISNIWTSDYTDTGDNKIYSIQKNNSQSNVEIEITDNVLPVQTPTYTGVDFNRVYTLLTKGLVFSFVSGSFSVTSSLNGHDPNVALFFNDEDPDYTYWIYQSYSSPTTWYSYRLSKYQGGVPENGDIIGTIQSNGVILKLSPRCGQQFFDLQGSNTYSFTSNFVDLSAGNNWNTNASFTGNSYAFINHIGDGLTINIGGTDYAYDWELDQQGGGANEYYFQLNADGVSGNWKYETGAHEGTWTYDGTNVVATATTGSGFTLYSPSPPALTNKIIRQISITNQNFNSPPTLPWDAAREYYFSFQRYISTADGYRTYYISNFIPQNTTDNSMEGLEGTVYTSPGAANEGTWTLNTATRTWTSGIATDPVELTTATTITLTNIVQYPTSQTYVQTGITYSIPIDGEQYGSGYNGFGATDVETVSSPIKYLGAANSTDFDTLQDITAGKQYDDINDAFAADNGNTWSLRQDASRYLLRISNSSGEVILTLQKPYSEIFQRGWIILRCDSKTRAELQTNDTEITGVSTKAYFTLTTEDIGDGRVAPNTNGENGTQYQFYENYAFNPVYDRGTLKLFENADTDTAKARIVKNQLLMTNIKLTMDNLEKINDFFRYTETYEGTETKRANIIADVDNYYTMVDFGRGDDGVVNTTNGLASTNTTGKTPVVPEYMRDKGTMNQDDGGGDNDNIGCLCPRLLSHEGNENRLKIFTRWQDDYNTRMVAEGMLDYTYTYGDTLSLQIFKTTYSDLYNYCVNNNVGIIPFKAKDGTLRVGFEVYQDYINEELLKIQNLSYFLYSPSFVDHDYVGITNNDDPAIPDVNGSSPDYEYSNVVSDMMNFINIGAHKPTISYNNELSRFSFSYWHTPTYFNEKTEGGATAQLGDEVSIFFDNNEIIRNRTFPRGDIRGQDQNNRNIGINESQAGIFLNEVYFQRVQSSTITTNSDPFAIKMTKDNFYNSFWFKLGYSYYDLKPLRFNFKAFHDNRFTQISYNNLSPDVRANSIVPFTTNAFLTINNMPSMNQFTVMSNDPATPDPKAGTPIFGLGYNNNQIVAVECESANLYPKSLPVNISSGYYRIYSDIPCNTLEYHGGGSRLSVVGSALLNYASSSQFFYSYGMDYNATITKDVLINNIKIEIRTDRGELVQGLGDRSLVVLKVIRAFQQTIPQNPELDELKKIENLLKNEAEDKEKPRSSDDTAQDLYNLIKDLPLEQDKDKQRSIINSFFDVIDTNVKGKTKAQRVNILKNVAELLNKGRNEDLKLEQIVAFKSLSDVVLNPNKETYLEAQRGQWVTEILNNLDIQLREVRQNEPASIIDLPKQQEEEKEIQTSSDILRGFDPELRDIETKTDKGGGEKKD